MTQTTVVSPYADYQFYTETYHGEAISEESFVRLEARAEEKLDAMTFHRIKTLDEKYMTEQLALDIRKAVCAMAEEQATAESYDVGVSSESNDGYSISYSGTVQTDLKNKMKNAASMYLADSCLLYRGGGKWHED